MPLKKKIDYRQSGVDIEKAEKFINGIKKFMPQKSKLKAFAAFFPAPFLKKKNNPYLVASCDGVGTKLKLAQSLNTHNTVGIDLVAMSVNDIVCSGARPLFFLDYIACGKLKAEVLNDVVSGIHKGLVEAECVLLGGETAEMPGMYKKDEYDLAGFCLGEVEKDKIIDGSRIKKGDVLIGLASSGVHSNGFSLVRKALSQRQIKKYAEQLLVPTRIYVKTIKKLVRRFNQKSFIIKGIAHITGGAFYNKLTKVLPDGLGFVIKKESWLIPDIFKVIQKSGKISEKEMYSVFNMGIGMALVADKSYAAEIQKSLKKETAFIMGEVVKSSQKMRFLS